MARADFNIQAFGYSQAFTRMINRQDKTAELAREFAREAGRETVKQLKHYAPRKTGKFAAGIYYRSYKRPTGFEVRFYVKGEHAHILPFLVYGTADHIITPKGPGYPLRFFWQHGPRGPGEYRYMRVHHPGTNINPFVGLATAAAGPPVRDLLRQMVKLAWL